MLTPQEVQEQTFEKAVFGGYDMAGVDAFLERVTEDYAALYKENAVLKSKLKVLVDTVEEYRSVDEAMRRTLFSAQKMADDMTREATEKSEAIVRRANSDASELARRLREDNDMELRRQKSLKEQTAAFVTQLTELYARQLDAITSVPQQVFPEPPQARSEVMRQTAQDISASLDDLLEDKRQAAAPAERPPSRQAEPSGEKPLEKFLEKPLDKEAFEKLLEKPQDPAAPTQPLTSAAEKLLAFERTFKRKPGLLHDEEPEEDLEATRPRFEFPNLQSQFGQQYSGHGDKK